MSKKELEEIFNTKNIDPYFLNKNLVQKKVCMQKDIGVLGNLFGGNLLAWIDESAAGYVYQAIDHRPVVTLKISEVLFKAPVKVNDVVNIFCTILHVGNSSVKVLVEILNTRSKKEVCTCELIFVHVDPQTLKSKEI